MDFQFAPSTLQFLGFINTPNIFGSNGFGDFFSFETEEVDIPEETELHLEILHNLILGKRAEYFLAFYLKKFSAEKILLQNQVIYHGRISIGEIDFLLQNQDTQEISHVELIYKYYLYDPKSGTGLQKWIGPNRRDSLIQKLEKLQSHQFPLLFRKESQEFWKKYSDSAENIIQKCCFKANLYLPLELRGQNIPLVNNACIKGYWLRLRDFTRKKYSRYKFYSPDKKHWFIDPKYGKTWNSYDVISEKLEPILRDQRSPLVWMRNDNEEIEQFFLVWW